MADELKRVGLVFKADGAADFQKTMQQVNTAVQENSNSFKLAKAAWDDSTTAVEKLKDRQEYLAKQTDVYSDKVEFLKRELEEMKSAENRNEDAVRKKQNQLTSAQISLTKYQKGLAEVTEELESGAAESKEQIRKLSDKIAESTDKIKANEIEIEALKSKYDDHIKSIVKYKDEQKYLSNQTENYERILESLKKQLDILKSAENKDEKAIQDKKNEINETTTKLNGYKSKLEDVEQKLKSGAAVTEGYAEKVQAFGNKAKETGDKFSGISTAAAGIVAATAATVPATAEYRKIMGSLEVSSQNAGYTAEQTAESYRTLYGVLADDQTAATTTANLQALGLSQEELSTVIEGTIGAWATYGDSIPIDGLAESINETVKTSTVIKKKVSMWLLVVVGAILDQLLLYATHTIGVNIPINFLVANIVDIWIICNELISILENIVDIGTSIPGFLIPLVKNIKSQTEHIADQKESEDK